MREEALQVMKTKAETTQLKFPNSLPLALNTICQIMGID